MSQISGAGRPRGDLKQRDHTHRKAVKQPPVLPATADVVYYDVAVSVSTRCPFGRQLQCKAASYCTGWCGGPLETPDIG